MKKTLLYFEEYRSNLSDALRKRNDVNVIFVRPTLKFMSDEYINETKNESFLLTYKDNIDLQIKLFKDWLDINKYRIDYFLNDSEYYMEYSNQFASKLGLTCLTKEQLSWVRDKIFMKDKFREIGLKTVDYMAINSKKDIYSFFEKNGFKRIVFKPRKGMNSIDTYMIDTIEDIDNLPVDITVGNYMVEVYTPYHEWSIESLVQDGKVLDSYLTYIYSSTIEASISGGLNCHMQLIDYPEYFEENPKKYIQKIVDGMELKNGAMTIEVFITDKGEIIASEMGWRLPGCQTTMNISISRGFNIYDSLIDIAINKKVNLKYKENITCPGDLYLPNKEGIIEDFTSLEEISKHKGFVMGELNIEKGKYQKKRRVGTDSSGWVIVESQTPQETIKIMKDIYENYSIITKEERKKCYVKKNM